MRVSQVNVRRSLEPGARVGDHLIIQSVLGKGGSAIVFEALHTRLSSTVALKVVTVSADFAEDATARLAREASVCAAIEDEHIPKVFDMGELPDGRPYMVMEKVSGPTLEGMLRDGPLPMRLALEIVKDLLRALEAVHRIDIVHRDIKPANLIIQQLDQGPVRVRLMDFGVSKSMSPETADPVITRQGMLVGTPHYMAPEQVSDEGVDGRTDLYAVGVLLYEMLTGRLPFEGRSTAEVMAAVLRHAYMPLNEALPFAPKGLCAFVAQALAERPQERFASARQMREALEAFLVRLDRGDTQPPPELPRSRRRASSPARRAAIAAVLAVSVAGVVAMASRPAEGRDLGAIQAKTAPAPLGSAARADEPSIVLEIPEIDSAAPPSRASAQRAKRAPAMKSATRATGGVLSGRREPAETVEAPALIVPKAAPSRAGVVITDYLRDLDALMKTDGAELVDSEAAEPPPLPDNPFQT